MGIFHPLSNFPVKFKKGDSEVSFAEKIKGKARFCSRTRAESEQIVVEGLISERNILNLEKKVRRVNN